MSERRSWGAGRPLHAALADPARLRIVDTLGVRRRLPVRAGSGAGDAVEPARPPPEGAASRRAAHPHAGPRATGAAPTCGWCRRPSTSSRPATAAAAHRVVFVCTANSARSQLAAALWRRASPCPRPRPAPTRPRGSTLARSPPPHRHRLPLRRLRPRRRSDDVHDRRRPGHHGVRPRPRGARRAADLHWSVPDPVRTGTPAAFDRAYDELTRRVSDLAPRLAAS